MAEDAANDITYLLEIPKVHLHYLGQIRHWSHLKMAPGEGVYWVKGLTEKEVESAEVRGIPFIQLYYQRDQLLFPNGGITPVRKAPQGLLWTPIERGLPVTLPAFNHNYFGLQQQTAARILPGGEEQPGYAMLVPANVLQTYIETAPAVRLQALQWVLINREALVLGTPLLPLQGRVFWKQQQFLLPAGYRFEWPVMAEVIHDKLNSAGNWMLWQEDNTVVTMTPEQLRELSISSFRLTMQRLQLKPTVNG